MSMKFFKTLVLCLVIAIMASMLLTGCTTDATDAETEKPKYSNRFVEVDAEKICAEYDLGITTLRTDGSKESHNFSTAYLVDQVSRRVYIYMWNTGKYDSGYLLVECLDADGNHVVYTGELP